ISQRRRRRERGPRSVLSSMEVRAAYYPSGRVQVRAAGFCLPCISAAQIHSQLVGQVVRHVDERGGTRRVRYLKVLIENRRWETGGLMRERRTRQIILEGVDRPVLVIVKIIHADYPRERLVHR